MTKWSSSLNGQLLENLIKACFTKYKVFPAVRSSSVARTKAQRMPKSSGMFFVLICLFVFHWENPLRPKAHEKDSDNCSGLLLRKSTSWCCQDCNCRPCMLFCYGHPTSEESTMSQTVKMKWQTSSFHLNITKFFFHALQIFTYSCHW